MKGGGKKRKTEEVQCLLLKKQWIEERSRSYLTIVYLKWMPWRQRALTVKVGLDRGSGTLTRKTIDMKKSIGEGCPCPDMMDHDESSLSLWYCLATFSLTDICSSDSNRNALSSRVERSGRPLYPCRNITFSHLTYEFRNSCRLPELTLLQVIFFTLSDLAAVINSSRVNII